MGKRIIFSLVLLLSFPVLAQVLPFVDRDFKSFVNNRVSGVMQREQFASYFGTVDARIQAKDEKNRIKLREDLRKAALDAMKLEHRAWEKDITAFLTGVRYIDRAFDSEREGVRNFLYWYGALEKFNETSKQAPTRVAKLEKKKLLDSTKEFFGTMKVKLTQASTKVGDWFKNLRTKLT